MTSWSSSGVHVVAPATAGSLHAPTATSSASKASAAPAAVRAIPARPRRARRAPAACSSRGRTRRAEPLDVAAGERHGDRHRPVGEGALGRQQRDVDALAGELAEGEDGLHACDAAAGDEHAQRRGVRVRGHGDTLAPDRACAIGWGHASASVETRNSIRGVEPGPLDAARLRRLIDAGRSLVSQLDLDELLERLIAIAADLTGARYVALGILDERAARARALPHLRDRRRRAGARSATCRAGAASSAC